MKKSIKYAASFILTGCMILAGCGQGAAPAASGSSAAASSGAAAEAAAKKPVPVVTTTVHNLFDKKTKGYALESTFDTIRLDDESAKAYPGLNDALKAFSENYLKQQDELVEETKKDPDVATVIKNGMHYEVNASVEIMRADEEVFTILYENYSFLGGPHPNTVATLKSFDTKTGKELALTDVVKSKKDLLEAVKKSLKEEYKEVEFNDLDKSMKDYEDGKAELNWGVTNNGITVYFNPYDLAAYAFGPQSVAYAYAQKKDLFTEGYKDASGSCTIYLATGVPHYIDLYRTGNYLKFLVQGHYDEENEHYDSLTVSCDNKSYKLDNKVFHNYYSKILHTKDNKDYIYVFTTGYSDVKETLVFEIKEGDIDYCGAADASEPGVYVKDESGEVVNPEIDYENKYQYETVVIVDPDDFKMQTRVDAMSTYHIVRPYKINADGVPEPAEEFGTASETITLTAKEDITGKTVDIDKNELKDDVTIKKGDKITIYRTNGKDTVIFKTESGGYVGLQYKDGDKVNGKPIEDLFENLFFAG